MGFIICFCQHIVSQPEGSAVTVYPPTVKHNTTQRVKDRERESKNIHV